MTKRRSIRLPPRQNGSRNHDIVRYKVVRSGRRVCALFAKGVWVGRSEASDEHIVLTSGRRVFSRTVRGLESLLGAMT